jgi:hypothetical protein
MVQPIDLKELLTILRENGVRAYKQGDISIEFGDRAFLEEPLADNSIKFESNRDLVNSEVPIDDELLFHSGV